MNEDSAKTEQQGRKGGAPFKRGMEQVESKMNRTGDEMQNATNEAVNKGAETMRRAGEDGLRAGEDAARAGREGFSKAFDLSRDMGRDMGRDLGKIAQRTTRNVETFSKASNVLMQGMQEVSREFMGLTQENMRRGTDALQQMSQVKTLPDMLNAQADLMRENLQRMVESARRIGEISVRTATEASETMREIAEAQDGDRNAA